MSSNKKKREINQGMTRIHTRLSGHSLECFIASPALTWCQAISTLSQQRNGRNLFFKSEPKWLRNATVRVGFQDLCLRISSRGINIGNQLIQPCKAAAFGAMSQKNGQILGMNATNVKNKGVGDCEGTGKRTPDQDDFLLPTSNWS